MSPHISTRLLPAGWVEEEAVSAAGNRYKLYRGPTGRGANSVAKAR